VADLAMARTRKDTSTEAPAPQASGPRVLKKYPNRRLYDTQTSSYITLAEVKQMVLQGEPFEVRDAKTGEELTRSILLQIILEEETGGVPIFTTQMLAQLIRFYGHAMQGVMGAYLEKNLQTFVELQNRMVASNGALYGTAPFTAEAWSAWLQGQSPAMMQNLMGEYFAQSKSLFAQMNEQLQKNSAGLFGAMPGFPPRHE
jgi:polyhydroxyalkanoate synthesis repressor PhaR